MNAKIRGALLFLGVPALAFTGCAHGPPHELTDARTTYDRVNGGPTAQLDPADLYSAKQALDQANKAYDDDGASDKTRDLAYVAQRKAELAEAQAQILQSEQAKAQANQALLDWQQQQTAETRQRLIDAQKRLDEAQRESAIAQQQLVDKQSAEQQRQAQLAQQDAQRQQQDAQRQQQEAQLQAQLEQERQARAQAEQKAQEAIANLDKVAEVKRDQRGVVISLSGSVLFASGRSTLLPGATQRLDQVADALQEGEDTQKFIVEGFTDSRGSDATNQQLSQARADAVRSYLVTRGVDADRIRALGLGPTNPVADNATAEGRANNRRVEIVVQPDRAAQSQQPRLGSGSQNPPRG